MNSGTSPADHEYLGGLVWWWDRHLQHLFLSHAPMFIMHAVSSFNENSLTIAFDVGGSAASSCRGGSLQKRENREDRMLSLLGASCLHGTGLTSMRTMRGAAADSLKMCLMHEDPGSTVRRKIALAKRYRLLPARRFTKTAPFKRFDLRNCQNFLMLHATA